MAMNIKPSEYARLAILLKDIEAVYLKRAARIGRPLSAFRGQGTSAKLLDGFRRHIKMMPPQLDKFGCDPHCDERPNSCPPCEGWGLSEYEEYSKALKIADAVDMKLLKEIHAQYVARVPAEKEKSQNPKFKLPKFTPPLRSQRGPGTLKKLLAFHQYLQTLPAHFSDKFGCDPHCNDDPNSCPPCEDWERADYERYLARLQEWVNKP
jgi:hypothetical protein